MALALEKIKGKIAENGLTQQVLANKLGVSQVTFSLKIRGKRSFTANEIDSISRVLKTPVEYFFNQDVSKSITK